MTTDTTSTHYTVDWSTVAEGWDAYRDSVERMKTGLSARLLAGLALRQGERVLELGAGTGEFARRLAAEVGEQGHVLATDVAAGMVDLIRATTQDLTNVDVAQADAADTGQPDAAFDAVVFRMGLMFLPEPDVALGEMRRVLRPGGRIGIVTWAGLEHNPWLTTVGMTAMMNGLISGGLPTAPGGPLSLGDPAHLEQLARDAGFDDVSVTSLPVPFELSGVDDHLGHVTSLAPPLKAAYDNASAEQRASWRAALEQATQHFRTDDGETIPGLALLLTATT
ncbi:MAG: class I SAM-dependent methyltransferase [Actinomycetes bacterium]